MKKLGTVKNIKIDEYVGYVTSMTPDERVKRYWSPDTCVWGKDNAVYNLFKDSASEEIDDTIKKC